MALEPIVAPRARRDIEDIFHFIAADDEAAAKRVLAQMEKTIGLLAERPFLGPPVLLPAGLDLRRMSVPPYVIFYRPTERALEVVRILHSSRDLRNPKLY